MNKKGKFLMILIAAFANAQEKRNPLERQQLYAPNRENYVKKAEKKIKQPDSTCIFCEQYNENKDEKNLFLKRCKHNFILLNKYPYSKGHLLIMPKRHIADLDDLSAEEKMELMNILSRAPKILKQELGAEGINIGINLGRIAGASKPDHLHVHIIPRYSPNHPNNNGIGFIQTAGETQVVNWDIHKMCTELKKAFETLEV